MLVLVRGRSLVGTGRKLRTSRGAIARVVHATIVRKSPEPERVSSELDLLDSSHVTGRSLLGQERQAPERPPWYARGPPNVHRYRRTANLLVWRLGWQRRSVGLLVRNRDRSAHA